MRSFVILLDVFDIFFSFCRHLLTKLKTSIYRKDKNLFLCFIYFYRPETIPFTNKIHFLRKFTLLLILVLLRWWMMPNYYYKTKLSKFQRKLFVLKNYAKRSSSWLSRFSPFSFGFLFLFFIDFFHDEKHKRKLKEFANISFINTQSKQQTAKSRFFLYFYSVFVIDKSFRFDELTQKELGCPHTWAKNTKEKLPEKEEKKKSCAKRKMKIIKKNPYAKLVAYIGLPMK